MGPPELPGGNSRAVRRTLRGSIRASMGPPELPGGNYRGSAMIWPDEAVLQWGRRNYPAETWAPSEGQVKNDVTLQWGRRNYPAETWPSGEKEASRQGLQWGRRNYPAETSIDRRRNLVQALASMGPPELPGGNLPSGAATSAGWSKGFNGAAGITRRKLTHGPMDAPVTIVLQWGRRNYPAETRRSTTCRWRGRRGFNGAAGITRRKLPQVASSSQAAMLLQWGRRNYPAETLPDPAAVVNRYSASMGPPELPGGNGGAEDEGTPLEPMLQWGRRNYPAETCGVCRGRRRPAWRFNGAAGITRRKPTRKQYLTFRKIELQWGRRNYPAETRA